MNSNLELLRVCETLEFSETINEDRDVLSFINAEKTQQLQQLPKYVAFKKWLEDNGVIHPAVEYPVAFGKQGQLIGMAAKKDVLPQKAFLFVPQNLIISELTVKNSKIAFLIDKHPEIFEKHHDAEYLVLMIYMFYEMLKGEKSFWHPYFQIINISDIPMLWSPDEIEELQDQVLKKDIIEYKREFDEEWALILEAMTQNDYSEFFPGFQDPEQIPQLKEVFLKAFISVVTRCFGWGLPKTSLIPFADCINHHNVDSTYELINEQYHQYIEDLENPMRGPSNYYSPSKIEGDYTDFFKFKEDQQQQEPNHIEQTINNQEALDKKQWPNRTLNQIKKMIHRKEVTSLNMREFQTSQTKDIWDVNYMSTSDEEDNDSEEDQEDQQDEQSENGSMEVDSNNQNNLQKTLKKKTQRVERDVIRTLIEKDDELVKRDLEARLYKIQQWKKLKKKFGFLNEDYDVNEDFSWLTFGDDQVYFAMGAKYKTFYRKGDQLFNCYGLRTNRFLLINYGFCLRNNKYNSLGFKVFVNYKPNPPKKPSSSDQESTEESKCSSPTLPVSSPSKGEIPEETETSQYQKVIRLKKDKLCEELLQYLRANLIFTYKGSNQDKLLVSVPADIDFEMFIVSCALNLMKNMLNTKYPTNLHQDRLMLSKIVDNWRFKLALIHRINQKEILEDQIKLLGILLRILARVKEGSTLRDAYCLRVEDSGEKSDQETLMNRIRLRKYLRELSHYQMQLFKNKI